MLENVLKNMTSQKVEKKAQTIIKVGRIFMLIGLICLILFLFILFLALVLEGKYGLMSALVLDFRGYEFGIIFMLLAYLGTAVGICGLPMYMYGIQLFTLARIAVNTEKE